MALHGSAPGPGRAADAERGSGRERCPPHARPQPPLHGDCPARARGGDERRRRRLLPDRSGVATRAAGCAPAGAARPARVERPEPRDGARQRPAVLLSGVRRAADPAPGLRRRLLPASDVGLSPHRTSTRSRGRRGRFRLLLLRPRHSSRARAADRRFGRSRARRPSGRGRLARLLDHTTRRRAGRDRPTAPRQQPSDDGDRGRAGQLPRRGSRPRAGAVDSRADAASGGAGMGWSARSPRRVAARVRTAEARDDDRAGERRAAGMVLVDAQSRRGARGLCERDGGSDPAIPVVDAGDAARAAGLVRASRDVVAAALGADGRHDAPRPVDRVDRRGSARRPRRRSHSGLDDADGGHASAASRAAS